MLLVCAGTFGIELVINFSCTSAINWFAVALVKVPVSIHCLVSAVSLTVLSEVILSLLAGLVDFISLVGEGTSHIPVLVLGDTDGRVRFNVGGVGGIKNIAGLDDLSWDDLFSSSNDVLVGNSIS